ncbi:fam-a protein, fragment [Plasmodium vinckei brucechwatti]|uniref:Fam-a protein n=1 Tax=Plasmodium vinckei brucechwatti TaxID=119398 RepID=A0A6V7SH54_PLAVN|nr:fam-a protein, fragment [Plasmodium vinckei brucechwatti]
MNKFYIQIVFFLLSIFIYTNNKALATGPTPREQINKLYDIGPTPGEQNNKIFDAVFPPEVLNKRNREYALSPEFHAKLAADARKKQTKEITKTKAKPKKTSYTPEERTIIVIASANINDGYPSNKEYKNTIVESANSFKTDIDSEDDIRNGQLEKKILNIAGYLIEKFRKCVEITYIESIDEHSFT